MATTFRALYQRSKGRDLFDVWYVVSKGLADAEKTLTMFHAYNKYNETTIIKKLFVKNMQGKKHNTDFRQDIRALLPPDSDDDFDTAFDFFVMQEVVPLI